MYGDEVDGILFLIFGNRNNATLHFCCKSDIEV